VDVHDQLVSEALKELAGKVDVVVLAQASMARVLSGVTSNGTPILSSPRLAVERLRHDLLDGNAVGCGHAA
jgi:hypothetical protein